ncbi:MAG: anti-sigma-I factor RsgI family protein [Eubacteriales bacterium]|jgi:hypothetical protein
MRERVVRALDGVRAEESLKEATRAYLALQIQQTQSRKRRRVIAWASAACMALALLGSAVYGVYFTPTSAVSIDVNPSIELSINRFGRVIKTQGYNEDGRQWLESLDVQFMTYGDAIDTILQEETVADCLARQELLSIAVAGENEAQSQAILEYVQASTAEQDNIYCCAGNFATIGQAHEAGISFGKYQAYEQLLEWDPTVTVEQVRNMTMREIYERIGVLSGEEIQPPGGGGTGGGQHGGKGNGYHGGHGKME